MKKVHFIRVSGIWQETTKKFYKKNKMVKFKTDNYLFASAIKGHTAPVSQIEEEYGMKVKNKW